MSGKKRAGLPERRWSEWFACCGRGVRVRFMKRGDEVVVERTDGESGKVPAAYFAGLVQAVGRACPSCRRGILDNLDFIVLAHPVIVCARCMAAYQVRDGALHRTFPAREFH